MNLGAPQQLGRTLNNVGKAKGCHEQRDGRLIHERAQNDSLDGDPQNDHDRERNNQGKPEWYSTF